MNKLSEANCPVCGAKVKIPADVELNEILGCAECEAKVEVIEMGKRIKLEEVKVEEDWGE